MLISNVYFLTICKSYMIISDGAELACKRFGILLNTKNIIHNQLQFSRIRKYTFSRKIKSFRSKEEKVWLKQLASKLVSINGLSAVKL
jgi:hypothetical protein